MGLFNWFSWQLERRVMMKEMDRLRADLAEAERQLFYAKRDNVKVRSDCAEAELLLHEAQNGAKQVAEEHDKLKAQLELHKNEAADWHNVARNQQRWIAELRRPVSELTSVIESTEPAETSETELEQLAREIYIHTTDACGDLLSPLDAFEMANGFIKYRDRKREESNNNGPF